MTHKILVIIRHAQSSGAQPGTKDILRTLTNTGIQDASKIGKYLKINNLIPDLILSSHATRALGTVQYIAEQTNTHNDRIFINEELFEASVRILLKIIIELEDKFNIVYLIGHNPSVTFLCEYLLTGFTGTIQPCGICVIKFNVKSWQEITKGSGILTQGITPSEISF